MSLPGGRRWGMGLPAGAVSRSCLRFGGSQPLASIDIPIPSPSLHHFYTYALPILTPIPIPIPIPVPCCPQGHEP